MAQLTINLPNNEIATIPDWKLDTEIENMAKAMAQISKTMKEENAKLIKAITGGTGTNSTANNASNNTKNKDNKAEKDKTEETKKATKEVGRFRGGMALGVGVVTNALGGLSVAASAVAAGLTSLTLGTIFNFGASLNRLTAVGMNQGDEFMEGNYRLRQFGMSLDEATDFTINASNAMQNIGMKGVTDLLKEFDRLTVSGSRLGIANADNIEIFREELKFATRMGNLNRLDEQQRRKLIGSTENLLETQIKYTGALGENLETIRAFAIQTLEGSTDFQSRLLLTGESTRQTMLKGAQEFVSVLRATGGTLGGELAAAAIEAGSFGAIGFSEAAKRFITVLPSLSAGFNNVVRGFHNGILDGEEAALIFTKSLGNLTESEKRRVFAIARTGDQQALVMAKGIMQFEKSFDKIQKLTSTKVDPNKLQTLLNLFSSTIEKFSNTFTAIKDKFVLSFLDMDFDKFNKSVSLMQNSIMKLAYTLFGFTDEVKENGEVIQKASGGIISEFAEYLPVLIGKFTAHIDDLQTRVQNYFDTGKDLKTTMVELLYPAIKDTFSFIGFEFGLLIKEMMMRLGNEMKIFGGKKTDDELDSEIADMKKNKRVSQEAQLAYEGSYAQKHRKQIMSLDNPAAAMNTLSDTPGLIRPAFAGDHKGHRFITGSGISDQQGGVNRPGNVKTYSLGPNKLSEREQKRFDEYKNLGFAEDKEKYMKQLRKDARRDSKLLVGQDAFKNSFDTDGIEGLSGAEFKAYLETLIMLTRKQTTVIKTAAE
jgi:hypothetical protein